MPAFLASKSGDQGNGGLFRRLTAALGCSEKLIGTRMDFTIWANFIVQTLVLGFLAAGIFGALAGYALASVGRYRTWIGVFVGGLIPVLGVPVLAVMSIARVAGKPSPRRLDKWWVTSKTGLLTLLSLSGLAGLLAASLGLGWFTFRLPGLPNSNLGVWGSVIGLMIMVSIFALAVAAVLSLRIPSRLGGAVVAAIGSVWLFLASTAIALRAPVLQLAISIRAVKLEDLLARLGTEAGLGAVARAPEFDAVDSVAPNLAQLGGNNLSASLASIQLDLGPAWYLVLAFAAGSILWSWTVIRAANRVSSAPAIALPVEAGDDVLPLWTPETSVWRQ